MPAAVLQARSPHSACAVQKATAIPYDVGMLWVLIAVWIGLALGASIVLVALISFETRAAPKNQARNSLVAEVPAREDQENDPSS